MRCSNIGPRGARNWFSVLDSPRQLLSPSTLTCSRSARVPLATTRKSIFLRLGRILMWFQKVMNMDLSNVRDKLAEASFFFHHLRQEQDKTTLQRQGDGFRYYFSAF